MLPLYPGHAEAGTPLSAAPLKRGAQSRRFERACLVAGLYLPILAQLDWSIFYRYDEFVDGSAELVFLCAFWLVVLLAFIPFYYALKLFDIRIARLLQVLTGMLLVLLAPVNWAIIAQIYLGQTTNPRFSLYASFLYFVLGGLCLLAGIFRLKSACVQRSGWYYASGLPPGLPAAQPPVLMIAVEPKARKHPFKLAMICLCGVVALVLIGWWWFSSDETKPAPTQQTENGDF